MPSASPYGRYSPGPDWLVLVEDKRVPYGPTTDAGVTLLTESCEVNRETPHGRQPIPRN